MKYPFPVGKSDFIQGDEAIARAAILAGCSFYAGYPITPASEIFEAMALYMPLVDGVSIQMEDELASIAAIIGASWAGAKAMTATSGPGFSLMMENLGYAIMTETPIVVVDVQRSGPSTGQPTLAAQGDVMQAIWGTHGDHSLIVLTPATVQEAFDMTIRAFNLAEKYRTPVILLTDAEVGHMRERVNIPNPEDIELVYRKLPANEEEAKYPFGDIHGDLIPPMPIFGKGYRTYVTGLTHDERGRPRTVDAEIHRKLVERIVNKIERNKEDIIDFEIFELDDADVAIVSYGIVARSAIRAVKMLRNEGVKAGLLKLNVVWPFDFEMIEKVAERVHAIYVPEMNLGQLYHLVKEGANGKARVELIPKIGGEVHTPQEIVKAVKRCEKCI
ncbi:MAG TPA: 2-oxoacid:acceptor oxidoreductase subunit alpha [Thermococcus paralvinellae]|uniref:2-oxoglutarate synthase subunit KorA n=1 Tax=Thermococcus paralvinellae TaxID=582419 RepID=A0A833DYS9_9EURY|nr:2-oxoacid:acceptor oxidoreductase subunit alpha [Thermococcus paralvinellae]HIP89695.1 2-oxoacid:acceptor oxidoreductase subunit alpha [Thermococcus paralvinellae]